MDLNFITQLYMPIVLVICLCIGFIMKKFLPTDDKWIPTTMAILGAILGCVANHDITLEFIGAGMVTGLASTGLHQTFHQLIKEDDDTSMFEDWAELEEAEEQEIAEAEEVVE